MKRLRSLAGQSPAITIAITALVFSLAGAAGATAAQPDTTWHWHHLSLLHNWHSSAAVYGTGSPSFRPGCTPPSARSRRRCTGCRSPLSWRRR